MTVEEYRAGIPYDAMGDYSWLKDRNDKPKPENKESPEKKCRFRKE